MLEPAAKLLPYDWKRIDRYPSIRSMVVRWDEFLDGDGRFLLVMWDAPLALWDLFFPARDEDHERPEVRRKTEGFSATGFVGRWAVLTCGVVAAASSASDRVASFPGIRGEGGDVRRDGDVVRAFFVQ